MTDEILYRADVICQLLGKRERLPDQLRDPLSQGTVESLDMIGDAPLFIDDPILMMVWNDPLIRTPAIGIYSTPVKIALFSATAPWHALSSNLAKNAVSGHAW